MTRTPLRILPSPDAIGEDLAATLLERIARSRAAGRPFLLGCPTGRTPRPIYAAMARRLAHTPQDLSGLLLVMMDEYLVGGPGDLKWAADHEPWSCHHFARAEILSALNERLPASYRLREEALWFPDPDAPNAYDVRIADAGGIDFFLLASGASDGHVAFNPPGSPRASHSRVVELSEETRRDNLATFPSFGSLGAVPHYGVCIGIDTIASAREAAMVVWGTGKRLTLARILESAHYTAAWPATVIHECARREIVADADAAAGLG